MDIDKIDKTITVKIGSYFVTHYYNYHDALKFVELAISGGSDPAEIKINITFYKKGEDEDVTEN